MGRFAHLPADDCPCPIAFPDAHIHVLMDAEGAPLSDIRTPAHNDRAADPSGHWA